MRGCQKVERTRRQVRSIVGGARILEEDGAGQRREGARARTDVPYAHYSQSSLRMIAVHDHIRRKYERRRRAANNKCGPALGARTPTCLRSAALSRI